MKIRIKGNSVRFRLTQTEVKTLSDTGSMTETTDFGRSTFGYQVKLTPHIKALTAEFFDNRIVLMVPEDDGKDWPLNDTVGFENNVELSTGEQLHLLLEKDFTCLDNTMEDQSDNYPNPRLQV